MPRHALLLAAAGVLLAPEGRNNPVRTLDEVEKTGQQVLREYGDSRLGSYGILDVTKAPYHADPGGRRDSTAAIQRALDDARDARMVTFLPPGTYLVSDTLTCIQGIVHIAGTSLWGADPFYTTVSQRYPCVLVGPAPRAKATIVLRAKAPGFSDPRQPKPVVHFWARSVNENDRDPTRPQPNISFGQIVAGVDFQLGTGNAGAVAVDLQAAQWSVIEDVRIDARGAFAGIQKAPGSGGGVHNLEVQGGQYGLYLRGADRLRGTQPSPVVSNARLRGQTRAAILYDGRGPLTAVGVSIEGAGIVAEASPTPHWNGGLNVVDSVIRQAQDLPAIAANHSVYLNNVYIEGAAVACQVEGSGPLAGNPGGWAHVREYAAAVESRYPAWMGNEVRRDIIVVDGRRVAQDHVIIQNPSLPPPSGFEALHAWPQPLASWETATNVREAPYGAKGDGVTDDYAAIQRAIDEHDAVFLPKGEYKLSRTLRLRASTSLRGLTGNLSALSALEGAETWADPETAVPLVETPDDAGARTAIAFVGLRVPSTNPSAYALNWRAGRQSLVRDLHISGGVYHPNAPPRPGALVRISGHGGGKWYEFVGGGGAVQGPDTRGLLIDGATEPLNFYMLNPEHGRSNAMIEARRAANVSVYSMKAEGDYTAVWLKECRNFRLFGYSGNAMLQPGWSVFRVDDSTDLLFANLAPQYKSPRSFTALGLFSHPSKWLLLADNTGRAAIRGSEQTVLYRSGKPHLAQRPAQ
jgi:hypothetical protein